MLPLYFVAILLWLGCAESKAVFAHFMVGNTEHYGDADFSREISLAQQAHIDAFALNFAYGEKTNDLSLPVIFNVANRLGFKLFFSFDYAGNGSWPQSDVIQLIERYASEPSYFRHEGTKPLVSTFEGPKAADDWNLIKERTGCFFMPSWSSLGAKKALRPGVADGLFSWAGWPEGANSMDTVIDQSYREFLDGKPYMMPVSPWFYTNLPGYNKNWLWRGDNLWYERWVTVFDLQPEYVQIISWNDFGESHYIGPLNDKAYVAFDVGRAPFNYVKNMPHDGWRLFLPYLIDMYKSDIATITEEGVVGWYRRTPGSACAAGGTVGNTAAQLQLEMPASMLAQDMVFVSALLTKNALLTVTIGGKLSTASWSVIPPDGIGLYHAAVPFDGRTGDVNIRLLRDGNAALEFTGASITGSCPEGIQNWNAWVGSASKSTTPTVPTKRVSELQCQKGWSKDAHNLMCSYTCRHGYCPPGPCTCSWLGTAAKFEDPPVGLIGFPGPGMLEYELSTVIVKPETTFPVTIKPEISSTKTWKPVTYTENGTPRTFRPTDPYPPPPGPTPPPPPPFKLPDPVVIESGPPGPLVSQCAFPALGCPPPLLDEDDSDGDSEYDPQDGDDDGSEEEGSCELLPGTGSGDGGGGGNGGSGGGSGITPLESPRPSENKKHCYGSGQVVGRDALASAADYFCTKVTEEYKNPLGGGSLIEYGILFRAIINFKVDVSVEVKNGCSWRPNKEECIRYTNVPLDSCDCSGTAFKYGGWVENNCVKFRVDPNWT
ncbi:mutanase Pc12g07500 [Colletotrichum spaethianum]|uniref:Mutanase Pc12g07500 n=1 Tax=Colletotrichum spaethianum TaxID=700344 RepID=A0AA37UQ00_9PEZI|nr:mutanase Pc12g07500 [Colletotrichum spaethianum]GKT51600.1 mutanase Pc12g07500 [Colletotrichum spaethianum]